MAELEVKFVHSNGWDNKDPNYDLGGSPSQFEIASQPMNNLFDNVSPEEAVDGITDYRCFYVVNNTLQPIYNVEMTLTSGGSCGTITLGTKAQNDIQKIVIIGQPNDGGFAIFDTEFGGAKFTCTYDGDWSSFESDLTDGLQANPLCNGVTVAFASRLDGGAEFTIEFEDDAKNRKVKPIILVQNSLMRVSGSENRVATYAEGDGWNGVGDGELRVIWPMSNIPVDGLLHVFLEDLGVFQHISYTNFTGGSSFDLSMPLVEGLHIGDEVWVDIPDPIDSCPIRILKVQDGWPINQHAFIIENDTDTPDWTPENPFSAGTLRPKEGFFVWISRLIPTSTSGCVGSFDIELTGD